jgi:hypothetical protein
MLDRSARYSAITCSRLKTEPIRALACAAVIRSSAPPLGPCPLLFACCSLELCAVSMSSAIAVRIARKSSRNTESSSSAANRVRFRAKSSQARSMSSGLARMNSDSRIECLSRPALYHRNNSQVRNTAGDYQRPSRFAVGGRSISSPESKLTSEEPL